MENGIMIKPLLEKADNFLQLALDFVVIILKSLSGIVGVIEFDQEDVCALANPERVEDAELVAFIVDELVLGLTHWQGFVIGISGCRIVGLSALRPRCGDCSGVLPVVGDVGELATKSLIFLADSVLLSLMLSGNLRND
jgi:hypothetical protein